MLAYIGEGRILNLGVYNVYLQNYASPEFLKQLQFLQWRPTKAVNVSKNPGLSNTWDVTSSIWCLVFSYVSANISEEIPASLFQGMEKERGIPTEHHSSGFLSRSTRRIFSHVCSKLRQSLQENYWSNMLNNKGSDPYPYYSVLFIGYCFWLRKVCQV